MRIIRVPLGAPALEQEELLARAIPRVDHLMWLERRKFFVGFEFGGRTSRRSAPLLVV
jgi:hypothetical protein